MKRNQISHKVGIVGDKDDFNVFQHGDRLIIGLYKTLSEGLERKIPLCAEMERTHIDVLYVSYASLMSPMFRFGATLFLTNVLRFMQIVCYPCFVKKKQLDIFPVGQTIQIFFLTSHLKFHKVHL